jgi:hypothetical protein
MNELVAYLGIVILGILVFALGNLLLGKKKNGGKRFVIFLAGAFLTGLGAMIILVASKAGDWSEAFTWCLSVAGLFGLLIGIWLVASSVKATNEKIEKVFDSILGGL